MAEDPKKPPLKPTVLRKQPDPPERPSIEVTIGPYVPKEYFSEYLRGAMTGYSSLEALRLDPAFSFLSLDSSTLAATRELEKTTAELRAKIEETTRALQDEKISAQDKDKRIADLQATIAALREQERLGFLLNRVPEAARKALFSNAALRDAFTTGREASAFVMSVDIRRSTELMLKARRPELFARFLTELCHSLEALIKSCNGVFDKFTGDGILAFFPDFFTGPDAAFWCVSAAAQAHTLFDAAYRGNRTSFMSVLNDVGLGIGIDYGPVHIVQVAGGITVVGAPVVYACRLSGAPPGKTLLNQPAYERVAATISSQCFMNETELEIKHEGRMLAYEVGLTRRPYAPSVPDWNAYSPAPAGAV